MYKLLIVDDETSVVDSLALTIPWEELGVEEVYRAYSAQEALQIAMKQAIDIIVTDIRMPEMDGLELIKRVRQFSQKIRCIILSGHDEFEYAQKAIQFQTIDYLLKPVDLDALIDSVKQAILQIEQEWAEISSYQRLKHTLHANIPLLRSQLLQDLLANKQIVNEVLIERLEMVNLSLRPGDPYTMMVVRLEEDFSGYDLQSLSLLEFAVTNIADEVFQELYELWHCITEKGYLVFLIKSREPEAYALIDSYAVKLQTHVRKFLKGSLSICLSGGTSIFPNALADKYVASISAIHRNVGAHTDYFITLDHRSTDKQNQNSLTLLEPPQFSTLLESGNWDEALAKLKRILYINESNHELIHDQLFAILLHLSSGFAMYFISDDSPVEEQLGEEFDLLLRKKSQLSRQRIYDWAEQMILTLKSRASGHMEDSHQQIVSKVRTYIQEYLAEGISLQTVADYVGLHPVYLSKVYKTVTGETIGDYIFQTRMERAAYLLRNTDLKILEISSQLGFLATPHFIKIFKKHYGCTPQDFRSR